jgi:RES domain-containing protein
VALERLRHLQFDSGLVAFRSTDYDVPFWAAPNTYPARWSTPQDGPTQYLCLDPGGCWADVARHQEISTDAELAELRRPLWVAWISDQPIADYSTFERAEASGFSPEALVDEDWSACQREGAKLRAQGFRGVASPSAALAGAINLTLFGPRLPSAWGTRSRLASFIPCAISSVGAPPADFASQVRYRGEDHHGLIQYRQEQQEQQERQERGDPPDEEAVP